jgi:hypothetical protein
MNNNDNSENVFVTRDLHFATFLYVKGLNILRLEKRKNEFRDRLPVYFVFEDKKKCQDYENIFWSGEGEEVMVNAKHYVDSVRALRARIASINEGME